MRRGPGLAGLQRGQARASALEARGAALEATSLERARGQLVSLRSSLTDFAKAHRARINRDPEFRQAFFEMCIAAGVDPLASSKGLWDEILGVGQFHNELAVQVLTVCMRTRELNGGLLDLGECLELVQRSRADGETIGAHDITRAVERLGALGNGVGIRKCGCRKLVCSVPDELSPDSSSVLEAAATNGGRVSTQWLVSSLGWPPMRADSALAYFVREGLCWINTQDPETDRWCWFPSMALAVDAQVA